MLIRKPNGVKSSEITSKTLYLNRRQFILTASATAITAGAALSGIDALLSPTPLFAGEKLSNVGKSSYSTTEKQNSFKDITNYNNFYELGTDKEDPAANAKYLITRPWTVAVEGEVKKPKTYDIDQLTKIAPLEERIYRLRCVEAWSMVVPWVGFPFAEFIKLCAPLSSAKYVRFISFYRPQEAVGQKEQDYPWPYYEGLRMDEAMNELTLLTTGIYGKPLPRQHGAPLRLIVPWKYGYKSPKSIVKIEFVSEQPTTFWNDLAPNVYSFLSNVDPDISNSGWSQATERDIGTGLRIPTVKYNG